MRHLVKSLVLCLILSVAAGTSLSILTNYTFFDDNINQITFWCIILLFVAIWLAFLGEVLDEFRPAIKAFFARQTKPAVNKPASSKPAADAAKAAPEAATPPKKEKGNSKDPQPGPSAAENLKAGAVQLFNKLSPLLFTQKDSEEAEVETSQEETAKTSSTLNWDAAFEPTDSSWGEAFESESDKAAAEASAQQNTDDTGRSEYADLAKIAPEQPSEEAAFEPQPAESSQKLEQGEPEKPLSEQLSFPEEEAPAEEIEEPALEPEAEDASAETASTEEPAVETTEEPAALPEEQTPEAEPESEPATEELTDSAEAEASASDEWEKSGPDIPSSKPYATPQAKQSRELQEKRLQHLHAEVDKIIAQQQQKEMTEDNLRMLHKLEELQKEIDIRLGPVD